MKALAVMAAIALAAPLCMAQSNYQKHYFRIGGGAMMPRADLRDFFRTRPLLNVGYGYRFHQFFQADAGLDVGFGAAGVREFVDTGFGPLRISDRQYFLPLGGRVVVPLGTERVHFSAGGGFAYMRYNERISQPFQGGGGFRVACPYCTARDGTGYYGLAAANVALDSGNHFRLGVSGKVYRGNTDGEPLGDLPPVRTRDHWVNLVAEFTVSF